MIWSGRFRPNTGRTSSSLRSRIIYHPGRRLVLIVPTHGWCGCSKWLVGPCWKILRDSPTQHFASGWSNTRPPNLAKAKTTHSEELRIYWPTNVEAQQIITHPERKKKENDWFLPQPLTWEMRLTDAIISGLKKALNEVNNYASFFYFPETNNHHMCNRVCN